MLRRMNDKTRPLFHFYVDDSGTRNPDHSPAVDCVGDWFGLGGIIVRAEDEEDCRQRHADFCGKWNINYPLHSIKIRHKSDNFAWMATLTQPQLREFFSDIEALIENLPMIATACVIDRPRYNARYYQQYGRRPWHLCKTAFSVISERACKLGIKHDRRVKIFVEKTDKSADRTIETYFKELRATGMPFAQANSAKYKPLDPADLNFRLLDLRFKTKECPMTQLADICLYPICRNGYDTMYRPFRHLRETGKLIECHLTPDENNEFGIKYSCFD